MMPLPITYRRTWDEAQRKQSPFLSPGAVRERRPSQVPALARQGGAFSIRVCATVSPGPASASRAEKRGPFSGRPPKKIRALSCPDNPVGYRGHVAVGVPPSFGGSENRGMRVEAMIRALFELPQPGYHHPEPERHALDFEYPFRTTGKRPPGLITVKGRGTP